MRVIDRRQRLSRGEFLSSYKGESRPVVLIETMNDWPALTRWNPDYLSQTCGHEMCEVMAGRNADAEYELHSHLRRTSMLFCEYVAMVKEAGQTNDFYLVAQNEFMKTAGAKRLYDDIVVFPEYLDDRRDGYVFLWFGPAGTVTPLHHDTIDIILAQVRGRKRVTMVPAAQTALVYNHIGVYSEVDCEQPDFVSHPLYRHADKFVFDLHPGEALFIPVGWWHHVRALDESISVSFTNFRGHEGN